ncbi:MAG: type II secretion system GspH family protein [Chitinophagaceae bacterium]|nr:type II secretion system GspH family protein [Chitinophagaceae bacterium]
MVDKKIKQQGFTVIEIMIAISIFSMALMIVMAVVIGMGKQYQKATYTTQLNAASRTFHQTIATDINYGGIDPKVLTTTNGQYKYICLSNNIVYAWPVTVGAVIANGLYRASFAGFCNGNDSAASTTVASGSNVLPANGFVGSIEIDPKIGGTYSVKTNFRTGTADMFSDSTNPSSSSCLPTLRGGDFCAVVEYNNSVRKRIE